MGHYDHFWEMRRGGPHEAGTEIFKCTHCGGETDPEAGWNGEPDKSACAHGCPSRSSDWKPGRTSSAYRANYDRIFGTAGAP